MRFIFITPLIIVLSLPATVHAQYIVDTGGFELPDDPNMGITYVIGASYDSPCFDPDYSTCYFNTAGLFRVTEETNITRIESVIRSSNRLLNISIYSSTDISPRGYSETPDQSIYTDSVYIQPTNEWQGIDLDYTLRAGTYWIVFEPNRTIDVDSSFGFFYQPASRLETLATYSSRNQFWIIEDESYSIPLRIHGAPTIIPLPTAMWLFFTGALMFIGVARNTSKQ